MADVVRFDGVIVDRQTLLDGTRELTIEAEGDVGGAETAWQLTLSFRWPKEPDAELEEGDLALVRPDGTELLASLSGGTAETTFDDETEDERVRLDLRFAVQPGEESNATGPGTVRVAGELSAEEAQLSVEISDEPPAVRG